MEIESFLFRAYASFVIIAPVDSWPFHDPATDFYAFNVIVFVLLKIGSSLT